MNKMSESDLYMPVRNMFDTEHFDVFSEVFPNNSSSCPRLDFLAKEKITNRYTAVELKLTLSLDLIRQAFYWIGRCNYIYICIPEPKKYSSTFRFAKQLLQDQGIGIMFYNSEKGNGKVIIHLEAKLTRRVNFKAWQHLREEQKCNPIGGSSSGGFWTPYKETMYKIQCYLVKFPEGKTLNEIVEYVRLSSHYSSVYPRSSIYNALLNYESSWCEVKKIKNKLIFKVKNGMSRDDFDELYSFR